MDYLGRIHIVSAGQSGEPSSIVSRAAATVCPAMITCASRGGHHDYSLDGEPRMATVTPSRHWSTTPIRFLEIAQIPERAVAHGWPPVWWVGCHGGAGVTTLARMTGLGG